MANTRSDTADRDSPTGGASLALHRVEEIAVGLGLLQLVDKELNRVGCSHRRQNTTKHEDLLEIGSRHQQVFLARAGFGDVDRRPDALAGHHPGSD